MHPRVIDILASVGTPAQTIRPTALYNEGWMLQLILDWAHHYEGTDKLPTARKTNQCLDRRLRHLAHEAVHRG